MTTARSSSIRRVAAIAIVLSTALLFDVIERDAHAQVPCTVAGAPTCDGTCPNLGDSCLPSGGGCICAFTGGAPCGSPAGAPLCHGECPPTQACVDQGGSCVCGIPTLSQWGGIAMSLVMLGGVLWLRRRAPVDR